MHLRGNLIVFRVKVLLHFLHPIQILPRKVTLGEGNFRIASPLKNLYSLQFYYRKDPSPRRIKF